VIEFYSPLTVIVGHNGSGKTVGLPRPRVLTRRPSSSVSSMRPPATFLPTRRAARLFTTPR
jgi:predicted ATP-dependent endonuclease of OLD family